VVVNLQNVNHLLIFFAAGKHMEFAIKLTFNNSRNPSSVLHYRCTTIGGQKFKFAANLEENTNKMH